MSAHPIDLAEDLGRLVRNLDRLTTELQAERAHRSDLDQLYRSQMVNGVLFAGGVRLDASFTGRVHVSGTFASVFVDDPNGLGPLLVSQSDAGDAAYPSGPGRFAVPASGARLFPLLGRELVVTGTKAGVVYVALFTTLRDPVAS